MHTYLLAFPNLSQFPKIWHNFTKFLNLNEHDTHTQYRAYRLNRMAEDDEMMTSINQVNVREGKFDR